jgi:hypothetical protein
MTCADARPQAREGKAIGAEVKPLSGESGFRPGEFEMNMVRICTAFCSVALLSVMLMAIPYPVEAQYEHLLADTVLIPGSTNYSVEITMDVNERLFCYSNTDYETRLRLQITNPDGTLRLMSTSTQGSEYNEYYYVTVSEKHYLYFDTDSEGMYRIAWENTHLANASLDYVVVNAGYVPPEEEPPFVNAAVLGLIVIVAVETAMILLLLMVMRKKK